MDIYSNLSSARFVTWKIQTICTPLKRVKVRRELGLKWAGYPNVGGRHEIYLLAVGTKTTWTGNPHMNPLIAGYSGIVLLASKVR